ncbi:MAG: electron transfer flavoprotein subunit alpha/FixB family protein [Dongiaceae bacterium]
MQRVEAPSCLVLAVTDLEHGRLTPADRALMGAARQLADGLGGATVLTFCQAPQETLRDDPARAGADRVLRLADPAFAAWAPAGRAEAVIAAADRLGARHLLFADTPLGGSDLGRRVAARLGERPAASVLRIAGERVTCRWDGGRSEVERPAPRVLILAAEAFAPVAATPLREALPVELALAPASAPEPAEPLDLLPLDPATVPLAEAELILAGGNGLSDWESFHRLAGLLGAAEGGSRVACDAGRLPRHRQVGASGQIVAPACYLALGISGAPQHLQGIAASRRVVAVNTDPQAEMVKRADLAVIGDAGPVMAALIDRLRRRADG